MQYLEVALVQRLEHLEVIDTILLKPLNVLRKLLCFK